MAFDLVIIGGGAAGFSTAIKATEITFGKAKIALINHGNLGGTCVNVGCVPSKYLLEGSNLYHYPPRKSYNGISFQAPSLDFREFMKGLRNFVASVRKRRYEDLIKEFDNIKLFPGKASFSSSSTVTVKYKGKSKRLKGKYFLIATGSRPIAPPIEGLDEVGYLDSNTVWNLEELPGSMLVIGGGPIALELGQAFQHLGTKVTIVEVLDRILPNLDPDISKSIRHVLEREGINIITKARVSRLYRKGEKKVAEILTDKGKLGLEVDEVLVATGRAPNTDGLNLDLVDVKMNKYGYISVDGWLRTSNRRVFAAGDVIDKGMKLETLAAKEGTVVADNIFGKHVKMDFTAVPFVIFTNPNVAIAGLSEREATKKYKACSCRVVPVSLTSKGRILQEEDGYVKMVIHPTTRRILGVHVVAHNAAEFITEASVAIKKRMTVEELIDTVHVFPTMAEALKLAALAFKRDVDRMPCCME
jgi:mercuric reductase